MDELDNLIIKQLQQDGRKPFTNIAQKLGVTEGTIRNRVRRLLDKQAVQIIGVIDPHQIGYDAPAWIGVTVHPAQLEEAAQQIGALPEVSYLIMVSGEYDLIVEVLCRNREHLASFIREHLQKVEGVQRTQTSLILHTYKMAQGARPLDATVSNQQPVG